jgi:oligopeptidase B
LLKVLIKRKIYFTKHLYAEGGSAGGLLMEVVNGTRLYNGVIAQVPFVDVITTMLDDTIPLTTENMTSGEIQTRKNRMIICCRIRLMICKEAQKYPNMFVSTGLHDSQFSIGTKWVIQSLTLKQMILFYILIRIWMPVRWCFRTI